MVIKVWRLITILSVALVAGLAFAHVLEYEPKIHYSAELYLTLQRTLYVNWGPPNLGGILEPFAIFSTIVLAVLSRKREKILYLTLAAVGLLLLAFPVTFFMLVEPANEVFLKTEPPRIPLNWIDLREEWELGHALRFGFQFVALGLLVGSSLIEEGTDRRSG